MTAQEVLNAATAAHDADRPLTQTEFQAIRDAINEPGSSPALRGALKELGSALTRQADARRERVRLAEEQERGRERMRRLEEREEKWQAVPLVAAAVLKTLEEMPADRALRALARHLQSPDRGPAPRSFMAECLAEHERLPGFFG